MDVVNRTLASFRSFQCSRQQNEQGRAHAHIHTHTHTRTHARTLAHTHTHTRTHTHKKKKTHATDTLCERSCCRRAAPVAVLEAHAVPSARALSKEGRRAPPLPRALAHALSEEGSRAQTLPCGRAGACTHQDCTQVLPCSHQPVPGSWRL